MKVEKKKRLSRLPLLAFTALLGAALTFTGCPSISERDDDEPETSNDPIAVSKLTVLDNDGNKEGYAASNDSLDLNLKLTPVTATDKSVTWTADKNYITFKSLADESLTDTNARRATVAAYIGDGAAAGDVVTVTARSNADSSVVGTYKLTLQDPTAITMTVAISDEEGGASGTLSQGKKLKLTALPTVADAGVTYSYHWFATGSGITLTNDDQQTVTVRAARTAEAVESLVSVTVKATPASGSARTVRARYAVKVEEAPAFPYKIYEETFDYAATSNTDTSMTKLDVVVDGETKTLLYAQGNTTMNLVAGTSGYYAQVKGTYNRRWVRTAPIMLSNGDFELSFDASLPYGADTIEFGVVTNKSAAETQYGGGKSLFPSAGALLLMKGTSGSWTVYGSEGEEWTKEVKTVTLARDTLCHFTLTYEAESKQVTLIIGSGADAESVTYTANPDANFTESYLATGVKSNDTGAFLLDAIAVHAVNDSLVLDDPTLSATVDNAAVTEIAWNASADVTALAKAYYASEAADLLNVLYTWKLNGEGATLSAKSTPATTGEAKVTLTADNNTINDRENTINVTALCVEDPTLSKTASVKVTVKANQDLLSAPSITAAGSATSVKTGKKLVLSVSGAEKAAAIADDDSAVTYEWKSSDNTKLEVTPTENGRSATVRGLELGESVKVTLTATLGSIVKPVDYTLDVIANDGTVSSIVVKTGSETTVISDTTVTALGDTNKATALQRLTTSLIAWALDSEGDIIAPTSWIWKSNGTSNVTVGDITGTGTGDDTAKYYSTAVLTGGTPGETSITITAGSVTATIPVEVKASVKKVIYEQKYTYDDTTFTAGANATVGETVLAVPQNTDITLSFSNGQLVANTAKGNNRYVYTKGMVLPESDSYYIAFDTFLPTSTQKPLEFCITTKETTARRVISYNGHSYDAGPCIFFMKTAAPSATEWLLQEYGTAWANSNATLSLSSDGWYHFVIAYDPDKKIATVSVTNTSASTDSLLKVSGTSVDSVKLKTDANTGTAAYLATHVVTDGCPFKLDNVEVYKYVAAE